MATSDGAPQQASTVAIVLAGGLGSRIRHLLGGLPKPLALAAGRPFLEWVIRYLHRQGLRRIIISSGYQSRQIEAFVAGLRIEGVQIECISEAHPMGTAGGFLNVWNALPDAFAQALVVNADSLMLTNLARLYASLEDGRTDGAIMGLQVQDAARYGSLDLDPDGLLRGFVEKRAGAGVVNGGVYLLRDVTVRRFPAVNGELSFEREVFPALLAQGARFRVIEDPAAFLDIGTEESLAGASQFISDNMRWFA
jgi:D-glycero-alpha-D-manno-heptose 1-phosphate guanylyltransferase